MTDVERWGGNSEKLEGIYGHFKLAFEGVVKRLESLGWKPLIVETKRSYPRQVMLVAKGASRTLKSKHLSGRAMDVIDVRYAWKDTPIEFIIDLFIAATAERLDTGVLFGLDGHLKDAWRLYGGRGDRVRLLALKRGWDPCHVEVSGVGC